MDFLPGIDELKEEIDRLIKNNCERSMHNDNENHTCSFEWWELNVVVLQRGSDKFRNYLKRNIT
jgi:hypothetical protein